MEDLHLLKKVLHQQDDQVLLLANLLRAHLVLQLDNVVLAQQLHEPQDADQDFHAELRFRLLFLGVIFLSFGLPLDDLLEALVELVEDILVYGHRLLQLLQQPRKVLLVLVKQFEYEYLAEGHDAVGHEVQLVDEVLVARER